MLAGVLGLLTTGVEARADDDYGKLLQVIRTDDAYKVRMQAIRVLSKQLDMRKARAPEEVIRVLSRAATEDEEHLVRGMACVALGRLEDGRAEKALTRALADPDSFVRSQARDALEKLRKSKRVLVISTDSVPGVQSPVELERALKSKLEQGFGNLAGGTFAVGDTRGTGYHMKGSVAELSVAPADGGASQVTIVVKIAIATWPDNNLRHVMSARASARANVAGPSLVKLQLKLLDAAVNKAIQDSMAQIGGG
jgi:hypothetical protein